MSTPRTAAPHAHGPDCNHDHTPREPFRRTEPKVGRNDPCHCGSGRKYKKCHGGVAAADGAAPLGPGRQ